MGSSGSQNPNWQRWIPRPIVLASIKSGDGVTKTTNFQVPYPDSRLRCKISLLFRPLVDGTTPTATLWLAEYDFDDSGRDGADVPLVDLAGSTSATPLSIPFNAGLNGWSREFVSAADYIGGRLVVNDEVDGDWVLQTRYQPEAVSFSPEEWDEIRSQCNPSGNLVRLNP
jgi:hypothetical protein